MNTTRASTFKKAREDGFTLTELFVVIVTVAILGVLLLPALAGTKPNAQAFQCLENLRQLTLGWQMYAEDNNGKLTPNLELGEQVILPTDPRILPGGQWIQWCPGNMKSAAVTQQTNLIMAGLIYPYVKDVRVYKCPTDQSVI
jgi:type II secretory pathway pseudopilin PulG